MRVVVEERHIEMGVACVEERCPIALAIIEALCRIPEPDGTWLMKLLPQVYVSPDCIIVIQDGTEKEFNVPAEVSTIIDAYDNTGVMYPFGFEL